MLSTFSSNGSRIKITFFISNYIYSLLFCNIADLAPLGAMGQRQRHGHQVSQTKRLFECVFLMILPVL